MDPDANLEEQLSIARSIFLEDPDRNIENLSEEAIRLAELVLSLDEWIRKGGFLPASWRCQEVTCKFCGDKSRTWHTHQGQFVCEDCWDERLRTTE